MNRQISPFAALTGAEKQIKWMEYQSIRLPYVVAEQIDKANIDLHTKKPKSEIAEEKRRNNFPVPPPEIPRTMPADNNISRHRQYDAVIARMKQAELQSGQYKMLE